MPNQPRTPIRGVRVPDDVWHAAQAKAEREERTLSDVIRSLLTDWLHG